MSYNSENEYEEKQQGKVGLITPIFSLSQIRKHFIDLLMTYD